MPSYADLLGYTYTTYFLEPTGWSKERCDALVLELAAIDLKIAQARDRIMATSVGDMQLDYARQLYYYQEYATELLRELSVRSGIPLVYNKYDTQRSVSSFSGGSVF